MTTTPVLPSLPEPAMRAAPVGQEAWPFPRVGYYTAEQMNEHARRAIESLSRAPDRPSDDALWDQTMRERDNYHEWADKLSERISRFIGLDIGEHSSANNPWARAIDMIPRGTLTEALASRAPAEPTERWYVGSMNDGCFIINKPPRPSHDYPVHDADVKCITGFPSNCAATFKVAQAICDAHNAAHPTESAGPAPAEIEADAARYRWLRDISEPGICAFYLSVGKAFDGVKFARKTVDEAIDAQIAAIKLGESHEG